MTLSKRSAGVTPLSTAYTPLALSANKTLLAYPSREPFTNHLSRPTEHDDVLEIVGRTGHSSVTVSTLPSWFMN